MDSQEILQKLVTELDADGPDYNGDYWSDCPNCGREKRLKKFSFTPASKDRGTEAYHCFHADCAISGGSLLGLAKFVFGDDLGGDTPEQPVRRKKRATVKRPERAVAWDGIGDRLIERTRVDVDAVYNAWKRYKPVTRETIDRYKLGIGKLPYLTSDGKRLFMRDYRLTVPQFHQGDLVGLYGRSIADEGWMSSTGSKLGQIFGLDEMRGGDRVLWVIENKVDLMLFKQIDWMQEDHDIIALQTARKLRPDEVRHIVGLKYRQVCVCLDNDLAGQAQGDLLYRLTQERIKAAKEKNPNREVKIAPPSGPQIVSQLNRFGIDCDLFDWRLHDAPKGADMGWLVMNGGF